MTGITARTCSAEGGLGWIWRAISDAHAVIAARSCEKTAKHAAGSAARNRLFLPWVLTTFGGMGPASVWHYVDTIYATSATLASQSRTSRHLVASRKADFLATLQAVPSPAQG